MFTEHSEKQAGHQAPRKNERKPRRNKPLTAYQKWVAGYISLKEYEEILKEQRHA